MAVTSIYRALMLEVEARRVALGIPQEKFSEWAGLPDRYFPKALHADTPSGRQASWESLQRIIDALFPHGFDVIVRAKPGQVISATDMKARILAIRERENPETHREIMARRGHAGHAAHVANTTPEQRARWARKAAKSRWKRQRAIARQVAQRGKEIEKDLKAAK